ncbi:MAG: hypothetical protein J5944_01265, partial [Lentisphaeria bacterium]|nr:hypothetical protein [Lentisphaeria bacterium]
MSVKKGPGHEKGILPIPGADDPPPASLQTEGPRNREGSRNRIETENPGGTDYGEEKWVLRRFLTKNEGKNGKRRKTGLKKTGMGSIFESPQHKNRRSPCRSIC